MDLKEKFLFLANIFSAFLLSLGNGFLLLDLHITRETEPNWCFISLKSLRINSLTCGNCKSNNLLSKHRVLKAAEDGNLLLGAAVEKC